jgi:hypothetical protein
MHAEDQARSAEARKGRAPACQPQAASRTPLPGLLTLQSSVGNAAVVQMLRQAGHPWAQDRHQHSAGCGHQQAEQPVQRSTVPDVLRSPGHPLDDNTRTEMEARLGADFSDVRLHTDTIAQASAAEVGARAYTSGEHVVIGQGGGDKHTLAHELTHVIQQRQGPVSGADNGSGVAVSDASDRFEREAEANAACVMKGAVPTGHTAQLAGPHGTTTDRRAVQRVFAANPRRGGVGSEPNLEQVAIPDTKSKQGEHVFNAFHALADEIAKTLHDCDAVDKLRKRAQELKKLRNCPDFCAAPAGKGNPANATTYSHFAAKIRDAVSAAVGDDPVGGWSKLSRLAQIVLDRAIDPTALKWWQNNAENRRRAFDDWYGKTRQAMTDTMQALLSAVQATRPPKPNSDAHPPPA